MEFKELQERIITRAENYSKDYDIPIDSSFAILKLYEELGEFTQALLIKNGKSRNSKSMSSKDTSKLIAQEIADVVCLAILNAHFLEVDLEKAIEEKWLRWDVK